jgi:hypothetical protein
MGMTLQDTRIMQDLKSDVVALPSLEHNKTILGVSRMKEESIRKVIQIEAEWFTRINPGYIFADIQVGARGGDSITYKMIFVKQKDAHAATH